MAGPIRDVSRCTASRSRVGLADPEAVGMSIVLTRQLTPPTNAATWTSTGSALTEFNSDTTPGDRVDVHA
jgi:hypothetical protein